MYIFPVFFKGLIVNIISMGISSSVSLTFSVGNVYFILYSVFNIRFLVSVILLNVKLTLNDIPDDDAAFL